MEKSLRSSIFIVGLVFLANLVIVNFAIYLAGALSFKIAFYLFLSTLISSALTVTVLGGLFTSLSDYLIHLRKLLKLNNLTNPLLLRLSTEAPGTYHHSVLVADLSSNAAKAIGADSLLCRVSAYFHDIGKLKNPGFFIENQSLVKNGKTAEYQSNTPSKNANIVLDHVKDGIKIAEEAHLPKEVVNIIAQHHGNSVCNYFYELAREQNGGKMKKTNFRYQGPKPQTKEAAILMLADSLEATARVKNDNLKSLVEETFSDKIKEGQLDDCHLSNREISKLKHIFTETLESMLHPRIEYPEK